MMAAEDRRLLKFFIRIVGTFQSAEAAEKAKKAIEVLREQVSRIARPGYLWPFFDREMVEALLAQKIEFCESVEPVDFGCFGRDMYMVRKDRALEILLDDDQCGGIVKILLKAGADVRITDFSESGT